MVDDDYSSRAKRQEMMMYSDFISHLPDYVIDQILVCLPIREAVRTSVLSTKWRYKWTTIPQLVFHDDQLVQLPSPPHNNNNNNNNNNNEDKLINFINLVLLLHNGFIHKFELSTTTCLPISSIIDAWILFLSRKNIKELVLKFSAVPGRERYKLHSCFFSAQKITTLELHWCVLKPPPSSAFTTGFSNLKSLYLHSTTFVDEGGFESLISKCPVLERLTLLYISGLDNLNISSPNLKYLCLIGTFQDFCFKNTPLLFDVSIQTPSLSYLSDEKLNKFLRSETVNVVRVLSSLPNLRKFVVGIFFLQFLSLSKIPEKLPFTCHHLNTLYLQLNFEDVTAICVTLCLLNSSPNLRTLNFRSCPLRTSGHSIQNFWEERTHIDWNMSGLQVVRMTDFKGFKLELEFIKLLLANSPMLEMLTIGYGKLNLEGRRKGLEFSKELLIFPRASPKAKIKFLELREK